MIRLSIQLSTHDYSTAQGKFLKFVTKMVLAAPEVGDISGGLKVGNEDEDGSEYLATSHIRPCFIFHRSFLSFSFFSFFFYFHALTIEQEEEGKKKINSRNCDSNFFRANHPPFLPSIFIPFFLFLFFSRNLCSPFLSL